MSARVKSASIGERENNSESLIEETAKDGQHSRPTSAKHRTRNDSVPVSPVGELGPQLRPYADNCVASRPVYTTLLSRRLNEPLRSTKLCSAVSVIDR